MINLTYSQITINNLQQTHQAMNLKFECVNFAFYLLIPVLFVEQLYQPGIVDLKSLNE